MLFLFQCEGSRIYALSTSRFVKGRLRRQVRPGDWTLHRRLTAAYLGHHYLEAMRLLSSSGLCILDLTVPTLAPARGRRRRWSSLYTLST